MFDYARRMKLAASDLARRISVKVAAGMVILVGTGFLVAALWSFLADYLGWGGMLASLVIGAVFLILGLIAMLSTGRAHHPVPTTSELKAEIEERLSLATDVVLDRVSGRAEQAVERARDTATHAFEAAKSRVSRFTNLAENAVHSAVDNVSYGATRMADRAEADASAFAARAGETAETLAEKAGLTPERRASFAEGFDRVKSSNLATFVPVLGAFAVGMTLAQRMRGTKAAAEDAGSEDWAEDDWADEDWREEDWEEGDPHSDLAWDDLDITEEYAPLDQAPRRRS